MKNFFVIIFTVACGLAAVPSQAQEANPESVFTAKVLQVLEEKTVEREDGSSARQQNLRLLGLAGEWSGQEIVFRGVDGLDVLSANVYRVGDRVLVQRVSGPDGEDVFFVVDFVRSRYLFWLFVLFVVTVVIVGRFKGLRSLLGLALSFVIVIKFVVPQLLAGGDPLLIGVLGTLAILAVIIYLTEGVNRRSHLAVLSVLIVLLAVFGLSVLFTGLTRLTGLMSEEAAFLIGTAAGAIDFRSLLLAGILIGTAGVLDDIVIGQIETVRQLKLTNPAISFGQLFRAAYRVGNTHLGAVVNTLFLTYAGASLPLLLLFYQGPNGAVPFVQVINNELVATEIVRSLIGGLGVALSMPVATFLAAAFLKKQ